MNIEVGDLVTIAKGNSFLIPAIEKEKTSIGIVVKIDKINRTCFIFWFDRARRYWSYETNITKIS